MSSGHNEMARSSFAINTWAGSTSEARNKPTVTVQENEMRKRLRRGVDRVKKSDGVC